MTTTPVNHAQRDYVLGADEIELLRLGVQHRLWGDAAHGMWRRARLRPGQRVLDVGCGPGFASLDLAEWVGASGAVLGVDASAYFIEQFGKRAASLIVPNARAVVGDVQDLPGVLASTGEAGGSFDMAFARWVLCFVPDPSSVVAGVAGALRPGGRLCVQDYVNYEGGFACSRADPRFAVVVDAIARSWRDRGGDPDIMGRLPALLRQHGFVLEHHGVHQRIARPDSEMWSWPDTFWPSVLPRLVASGHLSPEDKAAFETFWAERAHDPDWFMMSPPVHEMIAVKSG